MPKISDIFILVDLKPASSCIKLFDHFFDKVHFSYFAPDKKHLEMTYLFTWPIYSCSASAFWKEYETAVAKLLTIIFNFSLFCPEISRLEIQLMVRSYLCCVQTVHLPRFSLATYFIGYIPIKSFFDNFARSWLVRYRLFRLFCRRFLLRSYITSEGKNLFFKYMIFLSWSKIWNETHLFLQWSTAVYR